MRTILSRITGALLVGRDREITQLSEYFENVINGNFGGIVYIYGDAGIGKTKLITKIIESYSNKANIFTLHTSQKIQESFRPFFHFLSDYFEQRQDLPKEENKINFEKNFDEFLQFLGKHFQNGRHKPLIESLKKTKTFIGSLLGLHWDNSPYEYAEAQLRFINIVKGIKQFFKAQSLIKPLIITIEDIHWLDEYSKETIAQLLKDEGIKDYPLIVLTTGRLKEDVNDDNKKIKPVIIEDYDKSKSILLTELDRTNIIALIKKLLNIKNLDPQLIDFIRVRTGGNPYFIRQYCQYLMQEKLILIKDDTAFLVKGIDPYSLGSDLIVTAQIDKLSEEVRQLAYTASVLGMEFNIETIIEVTKILNNFLNVTDYPSNSPQLLSIKTENVKIYLSKGENKKIWKELDEVKYSFDHPLLCEKLYNLIPKKDVRLLHKCVAEALEKIHTDDTLYYIELAYHYESAQCKDKAIEYMKKSIDYSLSNYENTFAIKLYKRLLRLIDDPKERLRINTELAILYQKTGDWGISQETFVENLEKAKELNDKKLLADNYSHYGTIIWKKCDYDLSYDYLKKAEKLYQELGDEESLGFVYVNIGSLYYYKGEYEKALTFFSRQIKSGESQKHDKNALISLINIATVYAQKCQYQKALEHFTKALNICEETKEKFHRITALINIGHIYVRTNQYEKAKVYIKKSLEISKEIDFKEGIYSAYEMIGIVKLKLEEFDSALSMFKKVLTWANESNDKELLASTYGGIGNIYKFKEDYDKALIYYDKSIEIGKKIDLMYIVAVYNHQKADLYYRKGDLKLAEELNNKAINMIKEINENDDMTFYCLLLEMKLLAVKDKNLYQQKLSEIRSKFKEDYHKKIIKKELEKVKEQS